MELSYIFYRWGVIELNISRVSDVWFAIITAIVVAIVILFFKDENKDVEKNKEAEREKERNSISAILVSEIKINQKLLQPLSDSVTKALDSNFESSEDDKLPDGLIFESRIYSASLDKLGLLDTETRDKVATYYSKLKHIEEQYKRFKLIHSGSYPDLRVLDFKDKTGKWHYSHGILGWSETEKFLRHGKKVYDLGEELIIDLKEKAGIKPLYNHTSVNVTKEPLAMEHLRTRPHDVRKLWSECETLKIQISKDKKERREYIKNKSREGIPLYSKLDSIFDDDYISRNKYGVTVIRKESDEISNLVNDFATTGKMTKDEDYKDFVETIIKDEALYKMYKAVFKNEADLYEKTNEIEQCLENFEKRQALK